jgi:SAM-dependent methyltransferase
MKPSLLPYLACPQCGSDLRVSHGADPEPDPLDVEADIREGELTCIGCGHQTPIEEGVPNFTADASHSDEVHRTKENFGYSWNVFAAQEKYFDAQFEGWIAPASVAEFKDQVVLEAGCGMGRHTELVARSGAKAVIGVDFSSAVYPAERRVEAYPNAHIIRADINALPLKVCADIAFSVGVLHHLPDPRRGFLSVVSRVRPGGKVIAWVYGAENNGWITRVVSPLRARVLSKLPMPAVSSLAFGLTACLLFPALKLVYKPLTDRESLRPLGKKLFYATYLSSIAPFSFRHVRHIVFDHLLAPIAFYIPREEMEHWAREADLEGPIVRWHNQMSWTLIGTRPAT